MWRRACLGDRDAVIALGFLWAGVSVAVVVVTAARSTWPIGIGAGVGAAVVMGGGYAWRRRRWNRVIRMQGIECIAAAEVLLRQRSQGSS